MKGILIQENDRGLFDGWVVSTDTEEKTKLFEGLLLKDAFKLARSFKKGKDFKFGIEIMLRSER